MEQYFRKNNVEIKGVPSPKRESCVAIVQTIGDKIEWSVSERDLDSVPELPSKADTPLIIVRFCSRAKKDKFMSKARKSRVQTKDLVIHEADTRLVYVNEHPTPENKMFANALKLKRKAIGSSWTDDCLIKAKKNRR